MDKEELYNNVVQSLTKWIRDFAAEKAPDAEYVNWDEHATIEELPKDNILYGPAGCGLTEDEEGISIVFSFGFAVNKDPNLFMLTKLMSSLYGRLRPKTRIPIYDHDSTQEISALIIRTPVEIVPVSKAEIRSMQFVNASGLLVTSAL